MTNPHGPETSEGQSLELDAEQMRRVGYSVVDSVVDRWENLRDRPALRTASRAEMEARLAEPVPLQGRSFDEILARFWSDIEPYSGAIDHPRFFGFIPSSPTWASVMGNWLATGCNFFQGTWLASAGPSQIEIILVNWFLRWFGFPEVEGAGLLTSGGSAANLLGLAVAREAHLEGLPRGGAAYCSAQTHTATLRAFRVLGFPDERLHGLPADEHGRLRPDDVRRQIEADRKIGHRPFCLIANAGTTNTGAVDPLHELADLCAEEGLWLHVDGAYGAFAQLTTRGREQLSGIERADSLVLDPHKWFYTGYECGCLLVRDADMLSKTFRVRPDYLQDIESFAGEVNFADYGIQLTRRSRALAVWLSIQAHGLETLTAAVDHTLDLAEFAADYVRSQPELELVAHRGLGVMCFRYLGNPRLSDSDADEINAAAVRQTQKDGEFMLSSTLLDGSYVVRLCPLNYRSTEQDVSDAIDEVARAARKIAG